jgi:transcriptional regulator with XRE-family HTH domain
MDNRTLGKRIYFTRKCQKLSQEQLAELAELSPPYISHIERGVKGPSLDALFRIADALDTSMDWLLGRSSAAIDEIPPLQMTLKRCSEEEQQVIIEIAMACQEIFHKHFQR